MDYQQFCGLIENALKLQEKYVEIISSENSQELLKKYLESLEDKVVLSDIETKFGAIETSLEVVKTLLMGNNVDDIIRECLYEGFDENVGLKIVSKKQGIGPKNVWKIISEICSSKGYVVPQLKDVSEFLKKTYGSNTYGNYPLKVKEFPLSGIQNLS